LVKVGVDFQARTGWEAIDEAPDLCMSNVILLCLPDARDGTPSDGLCRSRFGTSGNPIDWVNAGSSSLLYETAYYGAIQQKEAPGRR
jgi:hypothetical protein